MKRNKKVTQRRETVAVTKPDRFTDAEWETLTPQQKLKYAGNSGLWKPGETGRVRGKREKKGKGGRPPKIPLDGIPAVIVGGAGVGAGEGLPVKLGPAFAVHRSEDPKEVVQVNGARLMQDAFERAARVPQKLDPFDMHVYLALLQKMPAMKLADGDGEETPAETKRNVRLLKEMLADDGQFREVRDGE